MSAPGHRPSQRGRRVLRALADSPIRLDASELMRAAEVLPTSDRGRKFLRVLGAMCAADLIASANRLYWIKPLGRDVLARLDKGECVDTRAEAPRARIFAREAA